MDSGQDLKDWVIFHYRMEIDSLNSKDDLLVIFLCEFHFELLTSYFSTIWRYHVHTEQAALQTNYTAFLKFDALTQY